MIEGRVRGSLADITLHLDEQLDATELGTLEDAIRGEKGVVSVGHSEKDQHLMLVMYDSEQARSMDVLRAVTRQGYHGELIGI